MKASCRLAVVLAALGAVRADIPVHCLRTQVEGKWRFYVSELSKTRSNCGHHRPDLATNPGNPEGVVGKVARTVDVVLENPSTAKVDGVDANWTMIYDEGFKVETQGERFFAFSQFLLSEPNATKEKYFPSMIHGKKVFRSVCGRTEAGWYLDKKNKQWGCYYGVKQVKDPNHFSDHLSLLEVAPLAAPTPLQRQDLEDIVSDLNSRDLGWTAAVYDRFVGRTFLDLNRRAGRMRYSLLQAETALRAQRIRRHESFLTTRSRRTIAAVLSAPEKKQEEAPGLPADFSWRNVSGRDFLEPAMDQQDCGSCYAVSGVRMLSARYKVLKNDPKLPAFSIDLPLYCADMNQGCEGGYPSLVSMWSGDVGLVPERCAGPYFTSDTQSCGDMLKRRPQFLECTKKHQAARVASWHYVGGYYGGCSEAKMREEMYKNGPLAVSLEPASDFMFYKKGIYRHAAMRAEVPWLKVDHGVLMVAWGTTEKGEKYWTIQNSWGRDWGEGGYMRLARGEDESGVEYQAVAAVLEDMPAEDRDARMAQLWADNVGAPPKASK